MAFADMLMGFGSGALTVGIIIVVGVILATIAIGSLFAYWHWKKYQGFRVIVWERDAFGNVRQTFDDAGIFVDKKTNNKRLFLKANNVGLAADNIPFIPMGKKKLVYVVKRGLKNFQFIKPVVGEHDFMFQVTEEDVNWAINAYERQKKLFQLSTLMQYMPFILLAFVSIIILIMFIYFFKSFPVLGEVAVALRDAATAFAQSQSGVVMS